MPPSAVIWKPPGNPSSAPSACHGSFVSVARAVRQPEAVHCSPIPVSPAGPRRTAVSLTPIKLGAPAPRSHCRRDFLSDLGVCQSFMFLNYARLDSNRQCNTPSELLVEVEYGKD